VRELENVIQRAVVLCRGRVVTPAHLMFDEAPAMFTNNELSVPAAQAVHVIEPTAASADSFMAVESSDDMKIAVPEDLMSAVKASEHQVILAAIQATDSRVEAAKKTGYQSSNTALQTCAIARAWHGLGCSRLKQEHRP